MCGIILILSKKEKLNKKLCNLAYNEIKKRGPDKSLKQYFLKDRLFIGNSILSIIGKIKPGKDLYKSRNNNHYIAYNGEIYNYKKLLNFAGLKHVNNDTELLVNLFSNTSEKKIPKLLDGMFAYCTFNKKNNTISLATDVQGERKLFIYNNNKYFICSSNLNSILKFTKDYYLNENKLKEYFDTRHLIFYNKTIYKNIKYLLPGKSYNYNISNNKLSSYTYDDPINWINKKKYLKFKKSNLQNLVNHFEKIIVNSKNKMLPNKKFISLFSGGIDSSLQSKFLDKSKLLKGLLFVDHGNKDPIAKKISLFKGYLKTKIFKINMNEKKYSLDLKKVYTSFNIPFLTHDLVGVNKCFQFVKKNNCKIVFNAGGVDELFGGYKLYKCTNWRKKKINPSPYSGYKNKICKYVKTDYKLNSDKLWVKAYKRYRNFMSKQEAKIQASLFADYFVQAVGVHNISWHLLAGENSIEVRNFFINKSVIQEVINLPIDYKINNKLKENLSLKFILKKIFIKNFDKKLVFKKQGFSGFPNETSKFLNKTRREEFSNLLKDFKKRMTINRENYWKILNIFYFKKFCTNELNIKNIIKAD